MTTKNTKAYKAGYSDGQEWVSDRQIEVGTSEEDTWERAVRAALAPGQLGADEGLINAVGHDEAAKLFGVRVYRDGRTTDAFRAACSDYNRGFDAALRKAVSK